MGILSNRQIDIGNWIVVTLFTHIFIANIIRLESHYDLFHPNNINRQAARTSNSFSDYFSFFSLPIPTITPSFVIFIVSFVFPFQWRHKNFQKMEMISQNEKLRSETKNLSEMKIFNGRYFDNGRIVEWNDVKNYNEDINEWGEAIKLSSPEGK